MGKRQRLDKMLAHAGFGSRREVKILLRARRVLVNGEVVTRGERGIDLEQDWVLVDGRPVQYREFIYLMLNKPAGYVTATKDRYAPTVLDLIPEGWRVRRLAPVGRLDKDTEGLLLLTNDGAFGPPSFGTCFADSQDLLGPGRQTGDTGRTKNLGGRGGFR